MFTAPRTGEFFVRLVDVNGTFKRRNGRVAFAQQPLHQSQGSETPILAVVELHGLLRILEADGQSFGRMFGAAHNDLG